MRLLDLTLPLIPGEAPYVDPNGYADPPTEAEPWVTIGEDVNGWSSLFHVSHLHLSAHAGTHIDAPSHFRAGAPTVSDLPAEALVASAIVVDLRDPSVDQASRLREAAPLAAPADVTPLLLTPPAWLTVEAVDEVIAWKRPLIAFAGEEDADPGFVAVARLLAANVFMLTNLDPEKAARVQDGDLLVVAPLNVDGLEGSPCRVFALRA
jgi:arylformamidase